MSIFALTLSIGPSGNFRAGIIFSTIGSPINRQLSLVIVMGVSKLDLPERYLITPADIGIDDLSKGVHQSLELGFKLIQLRLSGGEQTVRHELARSLKPLCEQYAARLLVNEPASEYDPDCADGLHLNSREFMSLSSRSIPATQVLAASCHNRSELAQAEKLGADFVVLSPVLYTTSHPDAEALGWQQFAQLATSVSLPVYALGGLGDNDIKLAKEMGAIGVAAISRFWPY